MGFDCKIEDLKRIWKSYSHFPAFSINDVKVIKSQFQNYDIIALGKTLSLALLKYEKNNRKEYVITELNKIFNKSNSKNLIISNIDILFNPEYNIDILGFFIQRAKSKSLIVLWPGEYAFGSLIYATPEHVDYKNYSIKNYNIIFSL